MLTRLALSLTIIFTLLGLAISRAWGWSEYASDELYLVYFQDTPNPPYPFFVVRADGSGKQWQLAANLDIRFHIACSPDGHIIAFLLDKTHLYVLDQDGVRYDVAFDRNYIVGDVANDGKVALGDEQGRLYIADAADIIPFVPPTDIYYPPRITSSGDTLWKPYFGETTLMSPSGETLLTLPRNTIPLTWLASEQLFLVARMTNSEGAYPQGAVDPVRNTTAWFRNANAVGSSVLTPDATGRAKNLHAGEIDGQNDDEIFLVDTLSGEQRQQLTYDAQGYLVPYCFLTFRPDMLIAQ